MPNQPITLVLCSVLSAAAGFGLAHLRHQTAALPDPPQQPDALAVIPSTRPSGGTVLSPAGFESLHSLREIMASAGPMDRFQALMAHVQKLPRGEFETALKDLSDQMGAGRLDAETMFATHLLLVRFGAEDPSGAMAYLKTRDLLTQGLGMSTVLASLASKDPKMAAAYFSDTANSMSMIPQAAGMMAGALAKEWASKDPEAALAWAAILEGGQKTGALHGIIGTLAVDDPARAATMAADVKEAKDRAGLYDTIARSWAGRDPVAAMAWAESLDDAARPPVLRQALGGWASRDGAAAAAYVDKMETPEARDGALSNVVGPWALKEPSAAATWLSSQEEGKGKSASMGPLMGVWTASDPEAASTWLTKQPAGRSKDEGIVTMASQVFLTDPASAMVWGATISNPETRSEKLQQGYSLWSRADAAAAAAWLDTSNLSAEDRSALVPPASPP